MRLSFSSCSYIEDISFYWLHTYSYLWIKDLKKRFFCDLLVLMVRRKQSVRRAHPVHYLVCPSVVILPVWVIMRTMLCTNDSQCGGYYTNYRGGGRHLKSTSSVQHSTAQYSNNRRRHFIYLWIVWHFWHLHRESFRES